MKRTFKTAIAMLLALIMAFGSLTAFAATPADIEWNFDPEYENEIYAYAGELTVADAVEVSSTADNNYVYYTFEAEENGYYMFSAYFDYIGWIGIPQEYENGVYYGEKEYRYYAEHESQLVYYLEAGEYVVGFDFYEEASEEIGIEFLGDIVNIAIDEDELNSLIYGARIYENYASENGGAYWLDTSSVTIEFENGKDITEEFASLLVFTDEEITKGEYEVEVGLRGFPYRQKATINVVDIKDIVAKVEIEDIENFTSVFYDYTGEYSNLAMGYDKMTITYTDGTTEVIDSVYDSYPLENGAWVDAYYTYDEDDNYCFFVDVAGENYIKEICTIEAETFIVNGAAYHAYNIARFMEAFIRFKINFENIFYSDSITESFECIRNLFADSASELFYTFAFISENTAMFLDYMF